MSHEFPIAMIAFGVWYSVLGQCILILVHGTKPDYAQQAGWAVMASGGILTGFGLALLWLGF